MRNWILAIVSMCLLCGATILPAQRDVFAPVNPQKARSAPPPEQRVDINHASLQQLLAVPGMTPGWAQRIVRYRPYRTKLDLLLDGIVTGEVYERIRYNIIAHRVYALESAAQPPARRQFSSYRNGEYAGSGR